MKNVNNNLLFFIFLTLLSVIFFFANSTNVKADTLITDNIQVDTVWTKDGSPYILKNSIDIALGITLTINEGVVVKFDPTANVSINVFGDLVANGTEDKKIYFSSNYDDTVGGDTDGDYYCYDDFDEDGNSLGEVCDGSGFVPRKNDWQGINFIDSHNDYLKNVVFKYANNVAYLDHTYLNLKNVEMQNSNFGIFTNVSNVDADNFDCHDFNSSCLYVTNKSNINWVNSKVDTIHSDAVYVYDSSTLNLSNFSIKNIYNGSAVYLFRDSSLNADNLKVEDMIDNFNYGIYIFDNSHIALNHSTFGNAPNGSCIILFDSDDYKFEPSTLDIQNSIFSGGAGSAILAFGNSHIPAMISNSQIENFDYFAIENDSPEFTINAEDNFWGNDTGPFHPDQNLTGTAGIVSDYVDFLPFCHTEQCKPRNPVVLVPGIMGTEIFKDYDDQKEIWPNVNKLISSISDNFLNDLALNSDGTENLKKPMKLGDIIRGTHIDILGVKYDSETFEGLITLLEKNGYVENTNLFVSPYDWRKSNVDSAGKLKDKINKILADTGADKVDIVAHSMGGLVAKKYIADNGANKVGQLIFIGTPQLGAPKAFKVIMEGDDMGIDIKDASPFRFLTPSRVKYIVQNMPGVFELLPSKKYIDGQSDFSGEKYITNYITPSFSDPNNPVKPDLSFGQTEDFLKSQNINTKMLDFDDSLHNDTDNLDLSGVKVSNFIGCGTTKTIGHITVKKKSTGILLLKKLVNTYDLEYENGDDTVPLRSADDSPGQKYYVKGSSHGELPSAFGIEESVTALLRGKQLADFPNISYNIHDCYIKGKTISLRSLLPFMEYLVYDDFGNYTGPVKSIDLSKEEDPDETADAGSEIEYGIPGVQYNKIGETTSIFLPAGGNYKIVVKNIPVSGGGGGGNIINAYDFHIENINADDTVAGTTNFDNVPVDNSNENFQVQIPVDTFPGEINSNEPPVIQVDDNGDGVYENEIPPTVVLDETQTNDVVAPNTTSSVAGNTVTLSVSDNNSGVSSTEYSLDGGNTWSNYIAPIEVNVVAGGSDVVTQYFSTDNAGNVEPIHTLTIPAPPLPAPVISSVSHSHNTGGMLFLSNTIRNQSENNNIEIKNIANVKQKVVSQEKSILDFSISDFQKTVLKRVQEPSLAQDTSNKNISNKINPKSQTATPINSDYNLNSVWFFVAIIFFILIISFARRQKKR